MRASFSNYLGAAGETNLVFLLTKSGAKEVDRTSRRFEVGDTTFAFDVLTDSTLRVRSSPFGKRAVPIQKNNDRKSGLDSKLGPESDPTKNQRKAHAEINENRGVARSFPAIVPYRDRTLQELARRMREAQAFLGNRFGRQTIDDLVQDIEAFHRRSRDGDEKPFGIVLLYLAARLRLVKPEN